MIPSKHIEEVCEQRNLDAFIITSPVNVRYITEFHRAVGVVVFLDGRWILLTDPVHLREAEESMNGFEFMAVQYNLVHSLRELLPADRLKRVGFEARHVTHDLYASLQSTIFDTEWLPLTKTVETIRAVKRPDEIEQLRRMTIQTVECFQETLGVLKEGMVERDVAAELEYRFRLAGADGPAFETIVAAGERSSFAHGRASGRSIRVGEPILFDFGMARAGYYSDCSRTVWLGEVPERVAEIAGLLQETQEDILPHLLPGKRAGEVNKVFEECLHEAELTEYCPHALGHGIGLEVHEMPYVMRGGGDILQAGMVITIEPGVYLPGEFGVRVEDMALVTEEGGVWLKDLTDEHEAKPQSLEEF